MSVIFPFPVLSKDGMDYVKPEAYSAVAKMRVRSNTSFEVEHKLDRNNLVSALVSDGLAQFCCSVSVKRSIFRITEALPTSEITVGQRRITARQLIETPRFCDGPEIDINCGVVICSDHTVSLDRSTGISDFYPTNEKVFFPRHSLIATTGWRNFFDVKTLFSIHSDKHLKEGVFRCKLEEDPLRIIITMAPKLYADVANKTDCAERAHVICTALTFALAEINREHLNSELDTGSYDAGSLLQSAEALKSYLERENISTWEQKERKFDPAYAASQYKPVFSERDK